MKKRWRCLSHYVLLSSFWDNHYWIQAVTTFILCRFKFNFCGQCFTLIRNMFFFLKQFEVVLSMPFFNSDTNTRRTCSGQDGSTARWWDCVRVPCKEERWLLRLTDLVMNTSLACARFVHPWRGRSWIWTKALPKNIIFERVLVGRIHIQEQNTVCS